MWDPVGHVTRDGGTGGEARDDRQLVARLREGEASALEELYSAYRRPIFGFLMRLVRDRYAAEDLFQNTWVKVSRSARRLREDTDLRAWMFAVARNEFRSYRRWQLVDLSRLFLFHAQREDAVFEETAAWDAGAAAGQLEKALAELGPSDREVLLLVCVEGFGAPEAAAILGVSHDALRQRLGRARARLKKALSKLDDEPSGLRSATARQS